jgi:hypothetical protein
MNSSVSAAHSGSPRSSPHPGLQELAKGVSWIVESTSDSSVLKARNLGARSGLAVEQVPADTYSALIEVRGCFALDNKTLMLVCIDQTY